MADSHEKILITGGTGSLGRALVEELLRQSKTTRITVFSRDELKQYEMQLSVANNAQVDYVIGDVRDRERLNEVMPGHTQVIHTAALKQVVMGEQNPLEYVKTNIIGTINVVETAIRASIKSLIAISTDKASSPVNLYGGTKFVADKYLARTSSKRYEILEQGLCFTVLRFGNFLNSRGSVLPVWSMQKERGRPITVTDPLMTRFWLTLEDGVSITLNVANRENRGIFLVPKLRSVSLKDLAQAFAPESEIEIIGRRPGEKIHEELVSESELPFARNRGNLIEILPDDNSQAANGSEKVTWGEVISYSHENLMTKEELRSTLQRITI
jgi:UDP-N-acetylglucosamine 4,6-dehydratase